MNDAKLTAMGMLATENKRFWRGLTNHTERCAQLCDSLGTASFGVLIFEAGDCSAVPPSRRAGTARLRRQDCAQAACASEHGRDRTLPLRVGLARRRLFVAHSGAECGANECVGEKCRARALAGGRAGAVCSAQVRCCKSQT